MIGNGNIKLPIGGLIKVKPLNKYHIGKNEQIFLKIGTAFKYV